MAAGLWYPIWGILLNPMFGAAAMSLSSFCVVTNALRLNMFKMKVKQSNKDGSNISGNIDISEANDLKEKGDEVMEKTMKIEGMMCGHCEARVKKTLEALPQVAEAIVSHAEGTAVVKLSESIDNQELKKVIEDQDYKVLEIIG